MMDEIHEFQYRIQVDVKERLDAAILGTIQRIASEDSSAVYEITMDKGKVIDALRKAIPADFTPAIDNGIIMAGFCPTCNGSVEIEKTFTRKQKGACCSWCGQRLRIKKLLDD